jgi:type II restriction enzyme
VLHQFTQARVVDYNPYEPELPTNSPRAHYALTEAALAVIHAYGTEQWTSAIDRFLKEQSLLTFYERKRAGRKIPVRLPENVNIELSPGKHNAVQKAVVEEFAPRFAAGAHLLYLGDTAHKSLFVDLDHLASLGISLSDHDKLPDVILHDKKRHRIFLIESVTSHGPMTPKRVVEMRIMFAAMQEKCVLVTAFPSLAEFRRHLKEIAWETEVWIVEIPDHLIHFNGDHFLDH